eukprot:14403947-Alexandrium_andersonii.AAC.1
MDQGGAEDPARLADRGDRGWHCGNTGHRQGMGPRQVGLATAVVLPRRGRNRAARFPHQRQAVALH